MLFSRASRPSARSLFRPTVALALAVGVILSTGAAAVAATAAESQAEPIAAITTDARMALLEARVAVADAQVVTDNVAASGLDLGAVDTSIDTRALSAQITQLETWDVQPTFLLTGMTDSTADATAAVTSATRTLRETLDSAIAADKAEKARLAAEELARQQAEAAAAALAAANTPEGAQATARQMAADRYGWGGDQFSCLQSLWNRESSWNYLAYNDSSGATGIPQSLPGDKMASAGADWQTNAATQISWGLDYISRGYGTPCAAWGHSNATGWY